MRTIKKIKNKYDTYYQKEGTYNFEDSMTDKTQFEDSDIKKCLEKYGMQALLCQNYAKEPLYLDNTYRNMTVADAVRIKEEIAEYYYNLPAKVRKQFGDNVDIFYEKYKAGEYDEMLATGILTEEIVKGLNNEEHERILESTDNTNSTNDKGSVGDLQSTQ